MDGITVCNNLIKWTMIAPKYPNTKLASNSFKIQNRTCKFVYDSGRGLTEIGDGLRPILYPARKARFSIDFDIERKFEPLLSVTILVSSERKTFNPERCYVTGEKNQIIWLGYSSPDLLGSPMTLQMVIHAFKGKL